MEGVSDTYVIRSKMKIVYVSFVDLDAKISGADHILQQQPKRLNHSTVSTVLEEAPRIPSADRRDRLDRFLTPEEFFNDTLLIPKGNPSISLLVMLLYISIFVIGSVAASGITIRKYRDHLPHVNNTFHKNLALASNLLTSSGDCFEYRWYCDCPSWSE
jgi:hypothetical protein